MREDAPGRAGRLRPQGVTPIEGSEFVIVADAVIVAIGTTPNPLLRTTTPRPGLQQEGLPRRERGFSADFQGWRVRRQRRRHRAATVILAMGAGKQGAKSIDEYLSGK